MNRVRRSGTSQAMAWTMLAALLGVPCGATGCSSWNTSETPASPWALKTPQMSPDAVVLEVALVPSTDANTSTDASSASAQHQAWWDQVDEQCIDHELRLRLAANGIRCGRLLGPLAPVLQVALDAQAERQQSGLTDAESPGMGGIQRLQNRAGKRGKVLTAELRETLSVLQPDAGRLRGDTLHQAQCLLSARSFPRGDGHVDLELTPEIEHGQARQKWLGEASEGSFRLNTSRDRLEFELLRMSPRLAPGELFMVGPDYPWKGLGRQFFVETANGSMQPRILIVRLAQTQFDDLFAPDRSRTKLATDSE